ncbi:hypothetical protein [Cupriavidus necator]|uniref:hypothetical protein n=1 Tax=Cupriavidus necator TaxID=106590 RepID=UPI001490525F|nr:hypothetical protein [Cupriavidus necator]
MATLRDEGFRFCASPDRTVFRWIFPAEKTAIYPDWTDCTDMDDAQFEAFVTAGD